MWNSNPKRNRFGDNFLKNAKMRLNNNIKMKINCLKLKISNKKQFKKGTKSHNN